MKITFSRFFDPVRIGAQLGASAEPEASSPPNNRSPTSHTEKYKYRSSTSHTEKYKYKYKYGSTSHTEKYQYRSPTGHTEKYNKNENTGFQQATQKNTEKYKSHRLIQEKIKIPSVKGG